MDYCVLGIVRIQGLTETRPSSKCVAVVIRATVVLWGLTLLSAGLIQDTSRYVNVRCRLFLIRILPCTFELKRALLNAHEHCQTAPLQIYVQ